MIAYLQGPAIAKNDYLIILTGGVGYQVYVTANLLQQVAADTNQDLPLEVFVYTHVKEDRLELYGFSKEQELELFKLILTVSGVGPKTALGVINGGAQALIKAVQEADLSFFTAVPRVGKKLAQKIIIELKSKLGSLKELNLATLSPKQQDVFDALLGLGFADRDIERAMSQLDLESLELTVAIKQAVKLASGNGINHD